MKRILMALLAGTLLTTSLFAENGKLDKFLDKKVNDYKGEKAKGHDKGKEKIQIILKTLPSLNASAEAEAKRLGGKDLKKFSILSGKVVELSMEAVEELAKHPGIHSISLDVPMEAKAEAASAAATPTSHLRVVTGATQATLDY